MSVKQECPIVQILKGSLFILVYGRQWGMFTKPVRKPVMIFTNPFVDAIRAKITHSTFKPIKLTDHKTQL